jgi:hypothetical protein
MKKQSKQMCFVVVKVLLLSLLLLSPQQSRADLILNGGFENGVGSGFDLNQSIDNWVITGNTGRIDSIGSPPTLAGNYSAVFGYGDLPSNGTMTQAFQTQIGQPYRLQFLYGVHGIVQNHTLGVQLDGLSGVGSLLDITLIALTNAPLVFSTNFIADSATTTLRFYDSPSNNTFQSDIILDSVSVTSVPEPSAAYLLSLVGSRWVLSRRRRLTN